MKISKLLLCLCLLALVAFARAQEEGSTAEVEAALDAAEEEDVEIVSSMDENSEEGAAEPAPQQEMSPEQQRTQARLQRKMIGYILKEAQDECANELREVLSMSPEQQQERAAATEGRMFSEECNTEINGKAKEFQEKIQSGLITFDPNEEDSFEQQAQDAAGQQQQGGKAAAAAAYAWSTSQIVGITLLGVGAGLAALYYFAKRRTAAFEKFLDEEPGRRAKYEKAMKKKVSGGNTVD